MQKASYATYKHIGFKLYLQAGSCTCLKLKEKEKNEKLFLELEQFFEMIVAEKVGWDAMETRAANFNHWENQPNPGKSTAYEIKSTPSVRKYSAERPTLPCPEI